MFGDPIFWIWHLAISYLLPWCGSQLVSTDYWPFVSLNYSLLLAVTTTNSVLCLDCHGVVHLTGTYSYYVIELIFIMFMRKSCAGLCDILDSITGIRDFKLVRRPIMICFACPQTCISRLIGYVNFGY